MADVEQRWDGGVESEMGASGQGGVIVDVTGSQR